MAGRTLIQVTVLLVLISNLSVQSLSAQYPPPDPQRRFSGGNPYAPGNRTPFSPYLNLLRRGHSTAFNYFSLVRPELELRSADSQFRNQFSQVDRRFDQVSARQRPAGSNLTASGHRSVYMSDLRGGPGSVQGTLQSRSALLKNLPENSGSRLAPTGHRAYFGNRGIWFPSRNRR